MRISYIATFARSWFSRWLLLSALFMLVSGNSVAQTSGTSPDPHAIPVVDGDSGPCSAEFTVQDKSGAPIYDAKIRVHIDYGFLNTHKLDLEVGTNMDGKGRFMGLPKKTKRGLLFKATQGNREGSAFSNPAETCQIKHTITIFTQDNKSEQQP